MKTLIGVYFMVLGLAILSLSANGSVDGNRISQPGHSTWSKKICTQISNEVGQPETALGRRAHQVGLPLAAIAGE